MVLSPLPHNVLAKLEIGPFVAKSCGGEGQQGGLDPPALGAPWWLVSAPSPASLILSPILTHWRDSLAWPRTFLFTVAFPGDHRTEADPEHCLQTRSWLRLPAGIPACLPLRVGLSLLLPNVPFTSSHRPQNYPFLSNKPGPSHLLSPLPLLLPPALVTTELLACCSPCHLSSFSSGRHALSRKAEEHPKKQPPLTASWIKMYL